MEGDEITARGEMRERGFDGRENGNLFSNFCSASNVFVEDDVFGLFSVLNAMFSVFT